MTTQKERAALAALRHRQAEANRLAETVGEILFNEDWARDVIAAAIEAEKLLRQNRPLTAKSVLRAALKEPKGI